MKIGNNLKFSLFLFDKEKRMKMKTFVKSEIKNFRSFDFREKKVFPTHF